jgi:1-acyl-sn-glycerol-3-phosphate acyltransferase
MKKSILFLVYQWLIALPVIMVITPLVAIATMILSPILPNSAVSYYPARWWGRIICHLLFIKVKLINVEKLDLLRSSIIIANHQSAFDIFAIYGWYPGIFKWIMKAELKKIPLVGQACQAAGHVFIDRSNPMAAKRCLEVAERQLMDGASVVIFPEGTRTRDGKMGKFKKGAFRLAADLSLPVVPVTIRGSFERLPRNSWYVQPGTIEMIFHDPISITPYLPENIHDFMQICRHTIEKDL